MRQLQEKCKEFQRPCVAVLVDLQKAYDKVVRSKPYQAMRDLGVNGDLIQMVRAFYMQPQSRVRLNQRMSEPFVVKRGLRQGCTMSPWLFNIFLERVIRDVEIEGAKLSEAVSLSHLLFADDMALFADTITGAERVINNLNAQLKKWNLLLSIEKTKVLQLGKVSEDGGGVTVDGEQLEEVEEFTYLGAVFTKNGSTEGDCQRRISEVVRQIGALRKPVLRNPAVGKNVKLKIWNAVLKPKLLYQSESWVLRNQERSQLNATEMRYLRTSLGLRLLDRVRNEEIRRRMGRERNIIEEIEEGQQRWYGHVRRMEEERIPKKVMTLRMNGDRRQGRPRARWIDQVREMWRGKGMLAVDGERIAADRQEWRAIWR